MIEPAGAARMVVAAAAFRATCAVVWAAAVGAQVGPGGFSFLGPAGGKARRVVTGLRYEARDVEGMVFRTGAASWRAPGRAVFEVTGPAAAQAGVEAVVTGLPRGWRIDWTIRYTGPARRWNRWSSGFRFEFGERVVGAETKPVTHWVKPTGAHPWEVPGDTPYPDTECQLREVLFPEVALVMISPTYDPDWIYNSNLRRARFWKACLPDQPPYVLHTRMTLLVVPRDDLNPPRLAAEAAGRPLALELSTDRTGNLFVPGEPVVFRCTVHNVSRQELPARVHVEAWTYQGRRLLSDSSKLKPQALGRRSRTYEVHPDLRGVVFVAARLTWPGGEVIQRMNIGVLPERTLTPPRPDSPFGMAAIIANPHRYPDQFDMRTVLAHMQRIGVRWIRGAWFPFKSEPTASDVRLVRDRMKRLRKFGILPHVQLGSEIPKPGEEEAFKRRVAATLGTFGWVSPWVEIGNELNLHHSAREYVERMLRPEHEVVRRVCPACRIMSMGFGGVHSDWLDAFVAAGGMELIDVLSVHPGCHPRAPEFWQGWRGWVFRSQMLDAMQAAAEHGAKDVWITEAYAPSGPAPRYVDVRTAADYLVRTYVCALALGVKVIEWYQFQDGVWFAQRQRPDDIEYNFGMVYVDLSPKPQYLAYAAMTEQLEGAVYQGRLDLGADDLYGVRFVKDGRPLDVLWSYREKHETDLAWWPPEKFKGRSRRPGEPWMERWKAPVAVSLPAEREVVVTDIMGNARILRAEAGNVTLRLTGSPIYVRGLGEGKMLPHFWPLP